MNRLHFLVAASALVLSGCRGGSSDSGGGGTPPVTVTPTPIPTPTPTPTPTSTYVIADYASNFSLSSSMGYVASYAGDDLTSDFIGGALLPSTSSSVLNYYTDARGVDISFSGSRVFFASSDLQSTVPSPYYKRGDENIVLNVRHEAEARYVTVVTWWTNMPAANSGQTAGPGLRSRTAMFGTPSSSSVPPADHIGFYGDVAMEGGVPGKPARRHFHSNTRQVYWSYQFTGGGLFAHIPYDIFDNNGGRESGTLRADGIFDAATNSISGTLTDTDTDYKGTFRAQMYGPDRAELGIIFTFSRASDGSVYYGNYIGKRI